MFMLHPNTNFKNVAALVALSSIHVAVPAAVHAEQKAELIGRVAFDFADAPQANVEVDLTNQMLRALLENGRAAIEGFATGLVESSDAQAVQQSAEYLHSVNEVLAVTTQVIQEIRVRVYENLPDHDLHAALVGHYQKQLEGTNWENVVRTRDDDESVVVCVHQYESVIRGVFVMVSDGKDLVLVNVVCELTPERVSQLTTQATKIAMKVGLEHVIEQAMQKISRTGH